MTVALTNGSHTGFFDLFGWFAGRAADVNAWRGGPATSNVLSAANLATDVNTLEGWYRTAGISQVAEGVYQDEANAQGAMAPFITALQLRAQNTLVAMVAVDKGQSANSPAAALTSGDVTAALQYLSSQMSTNSTSVNASASTAGSQTNVGSPVGNAIIVPSVKTTAGVNLQYPYPETLTFTVTKDVAGGATAGAEIVTCTGQPPAINSQGQADPLSQLWPGGSGASQAYQLVNGAVNCPIAQGVSATAGVNLLTNGDFAAFNTNYPNNWNIITGAVTTSFLNGGSGNAYTPGGSGGSLQILGGGVSHPAIAQPFNVAPSTTNAIGGTPAKLLGGMQIAVNGWLKMSSTPAAGVLRVALVDGANAVINDDNGVGNSFTQSLTAISTTFVNFNGVFRLPANIAGITQPIQLMLSTPVTDIDTGKSLYIGRLAAALMVPAYPSGPSFAGFSGSTNVNAQGATPDGWTFVIGNTWGVVQKWLYRFFNTQIVKAGIQFPPSGSPTVADAVVA